MSSKGVAFFGRRKIVHVLLTFWPLLFAYLGLPLEEEVLLYAVYLALWLLSECVRVRYGAWTPTAPIIRAISRSRFDGTFRRDWKRVRVPYWIIGSMLAMPFGAVPLIAATACLSFGDATSGMVKAALGVRSSPAGPAAMFAVSAAAILALTGNLAVSVAAAGLGALGDAINSVNDNLTIPTFSAIGAWIALAAAPIYTGSGTDIHNGLVMG